VDYESYLALFTVRDGIQLPALPNLQNSSNFRPGDWLVREGRSPTGAESRSLTLLESLRGTEQGETVGLIADASAQADGTVLIDVSGRVAGIYVRPNDSGGFVVPIRRALEVAARLKANPIVMPTGWIGVELQELTDDLRQYFSASNGALVSSVVPNGPAADAGLRAMDLIETIGGESVASASQLMDVILKSAPGTKFQFGVKRKALVRSLNVTVMPPPEHRASQTSSDSSSLVLSLVGPGFDGGVMISAIEPRSVGYRIGIQTGDIVRSVDGTDIRSSTHFWAVQRAMAPGKSQLWGIQRGAAFFFVMIKQSVKPA
jgi:serine protease Do